MPLPSFDDRDGKIWWNGAFVDWRDAKIHVLTHGLHYGSCVFEGERAYSCKIFKSLEHSERLHMSAKLLGMKLPYSVEELEKAKQETLEINALDDAYVRVVAWRGSEMMAVSAQHNTIHVAVTTWAMGSYFGDARLKGVNLGISKWKRPSPETIPCKAKAAGLYMICTLSKHEAEANGLTDALMMDYRGYVAEATGANIFFVKDNKVHTPLPDCFLDGITRRTVIGLLREKGLEVIERHIQPDELETFEQCFLTGTAAEVTPVASISTHKYSIGTITQQVMQDYEDLVRAHAKA
jgi:branched-chain amino acid aminotransferase